MIRLTRTRIWTRLLLAVLMLVQASPTETHNAIPTPTHNAISWKFLICAAPLIHSLYTYYSTLPHSNPNRYSKERLAAAWKALENADTSKDDQAYNKALADLASELWYFYVDGLCGHMSAVEGPHHHGPHHKTEMILIPSRAIYGKIGSVCNPLAKAVGLTCFLKYALETRGRTIFKWMEGLAGAVAPAHVH